MGIIRNWFRRMVADAMREGEQMLRVGPTPDSSSLGQEVFNIRRIENGYLVIGMNPMTYSPKVTYVETAGELGDHITSRAAENILAHGSATNKVANGIQAAQGVAARRSW